ncbi:hypothetical protein OH77DRAFT_1416577 [Trametes cingulata]|nr:hypothetical protein OH77DRAFT_1416577 [Trametes cingulata]
MPELDILHGFEYIVQRLTRDWEGKHGTPFRARLMLCPQAFAVADDYITCTVDHSAFCDYSDDLEPCPADYIPAPHDRRRSAGQDFERYLKPLKEGQLHVKARGKEMILAAGYHAVRVHFGLEGTMVVLPTSSFKSMLLQSCPGNNKDPEVADIMRSYRIPRELIIPEARDREQQKLAVFAAFIGEEDTIALVDHNRLLRLHVLSIGREWTVNDLQRSSPMWQHLWSSNHGPDWISEKAEAETALDKWRAAVLSPKPAASMPMPPQEQRITRFFTETSSGKPVQLLFDDPTFNSDARASPSLVESLCDLQFVFNGYGQHTSNDLLHRLALWPGMPPEKLCRDEQLYQDFKKALAAYAAQFATPEYYSRCLGVPNRGAALAFNYKSDDNYIAKYVDVFRKALVRMDAALYNKYAMQGLFNPQHIIGQPYQYREDELIRVKHKDVLGFTYKLGERQKDRMFSVIRAIPPASWRGAGIVAELTKDLRAAGFNTTIGPASFYAFKQNQYDWKHIEVKPGPKPREYTGKRGRPAAQVPNHKVLRDRQEKGDKIMKKAETMLAREKAELLVQIDSERPAKRIRIGRGAIFDTDRSTRSTSSTSSTGSPSGPATPTPSGTPDI